MIRHFRHALGALRYSLAGIVTCFREETAFRQEIALGVVHFTALFLLPLSALERLSLTVLYLLILATELLNTGLEAIVNYACGEIHPLAKKAKDCASAAVFCVLVAYFVSWAVILVLLFRA